MNKTDLDDYPMDLTEVCLYSGYDRRIIQENTALGHLRAYNHAGKSRFRRWYKSDVDAWLKARPVEQEAG